MPDRVSDTPELKRKMTVWLTGAVTLVLLVGVIIFIVLHEASKRQEDRIVARYVLCRELESIKHAQRVDLRESIRQSEEFLRGNPRGIPGISPALIRRGIDRDRRLLKSLAPYPRGCAAFARNPAETDVQVPPLPKE